MTRKDYVLIANVIAYFRDLKLNLDDSSTWDLLSIGFANKLSETNPNFDKTKFLLACGVKPNVL